MKPKVLVFFKKIYLHFFNLRFDLLSAYAAASTLFIFISFFPFIMMLLGGLRFLPFSHEHFAMFGLDFIPQDIQKLLVTITQEISSNTPGLYISISVIITALWTTSSGFLSLTRGLNVIGGCKESRNPIVLRLLCVLYTVIFMVLIIVTLILLVFGNGILGWLGEILPLITPAVSLIKHFRIIGTLVVLVLFFVLLYKYAPNKKKRFREEIPGAVIAASGWIIFSYIYSLYISLVSNGSIIYGSLSALVFMFIWMYACILILFYGAYVNELIKKYQKDQNSRKS